MRQSISIQEGGSGVKILVDKEHVKTIPGKFKKVVKKKHIMNPLRKRLTAEERFLLEVALFEEVLKRERPLVYGVIKRSIPDFVRKITNFQGSEYYELVYKNKMALKTHINIYRLCPDKRDIKRNF